MIFFIKPLLASLLAWLFLKEKITIQLVIGTIVILVGIIIVQQSDNVLKAIKKGTFYSPHIKNQ
ncbi:MAG: EamA family transporter [Thermovenabulum sp.]|uniref:EamA family transporter n=1 Tax=Thermovenabulum sp. TaxID=3100335 RepID=UPI003C7988AF